VVSVLAGTSGFSYSEWKGSFYPPDLPARRMLEFYATRLSAVEINNTFYRMPRPELVQGWAGQVSPSFRFVLKAPQRITHRERLARSEESLSAFLRVATLLGERLGAVLFQLPPFLKQDAPLLAGFLGLLPEGTRAAFEFRHPSWFSEETYGALRARNVALVGGDADEAGKSPPLVATADYGYLRLRAPSYSEDELTTWAGRIAAQPWKSCFAFLKHELRGPEFAETLARLSGSP